MITAKVTVSLQGWRCFIFACFSFSSSSFHREETGHQRGEVTAEIHTTLSEGSALGEGLSVRSP